MDDDHRLLFFHIEYLQRRLEVQKQVSATLVEMFKAAQEVAAVPPDEQTREQMLERLTEIRSTIQSGIDAAARADHYDEQLEAQLAQLKRKFGIQE